MAGRHNFRYSIGILCCLAVILTSISLVTKDAECFHVLTCGLYVFLSFSFNELFDFLIVSFESSLYSLSTNPLPDM